MRVCLFRKSLLHHHAGDVAQGVVHGRGQRHAAQEYLAGAFADDGGDEVELRFVEEVDDFDGTSDGEVEESVMCDGNAVFRTVRPGDERGDVVDVRLSLRGVFLPDPDRIVFFFFAVCHICRLLFVLMTAFYSPIVYDLFPKRKSSVFVLLIFRKRKAELFRSALP